MENKKFIVAQLLMLKRTYTFATTIPNDTITNSIPALQTSFNTLSGKITTIDQLFAKYADIITGYAAAKKQARTELAIISYIMMKATYALAINTDNLVLAAEMKTNLSKLKRTGFGALCHQMTLNTTIVQPLLGALVNYNPNANTDFNTWQNKLTALKQLLVTPRQMIISRTQTGKNITVTMKQAMTLTRLTIDSIVAVMILSHPDYNSEYFLQRIIVDPANRHTLLSATVVNELGQPIVGAIVTVDEFTKIIDPNTDPMKTRTFAAKSELTDIDGLAEVKTFEPGIRTVTVSGENVVTKKFGPYQFEQGKTLSQTFICQPSFQNIPAPKTESETRKATN